MKLPSLAIVLIALSLIAFVATRPGFKPRWSEAVPAELPASNSLEPPSETAASLAQSSQAERSSPPANLSEWLRRFRYSDRKPSLDQGLDLAAARRARMARLIREDPGAAIDSMLPYSDYLALPPEIARLIERPFACATDFQAIATCDQRHARPHPTRFFIDLETRRIELHLPPERAGLTSKYQMPLSGIAIDGHGTIHRAAAPALSAGEAYAAKELLGLTILPSETPDVSVYRLVGDRLHPLEPSEQLSLSLRLSIAEKAPTPYASSAALSYSETTQTVEAYRIYIHKLIESWTRTAKRILLIRLNFQNEDSGLSRETAESYLDATAHFVHENSYGKTEVSSDSVITEKLTLSKGAQDYGNGDEFDYHQLKYDALDLAREAGHDPDQFDIVIYQFPHKSLDWGGRASIAGKDQWINGTSHSKTFVHEIGHNYGLYHASLWKPLPPSIMSPPGEDYTLNSPFHDEYGDYSDPMGRSGPENHYSAYGKARLLWFDEDQILNLESGVDRVIRLYPFDDPNVDPTRIRLLNIQYSESEVFNIAYRYNASGSTNFDQGAYVTWAYTADRARLLHMDGRAQSQSSSKKAALEVGQTFADPTGVVSLQTNARGGEGPDAWIEVKASLRIDNNEPPIIVDRQFPASVKARTVYDFQLQAYDPENEQLSYEWNFGNGYPIASQTPTLSHSYPVGGDYEIEITVKDSVGNYARQRVPLTVSDPLAPLSHIYPWGYYPAHFLRYQEGRFLARSYEDIYLSIDGENWTSSSPDLAVYCSLIADGAIFAAGRNWAAGSFHYQGGIAVSREGRDWTALELPEETTLIHDLAYGDATLLALTDNAILSTHDYENWQVAAAPWRQYRKGLCFGNGAFLAIDERSRLFASYDSGRTWQDITNRLKTSSVSHVVFNNNAFHCVSNNKLHLSSDAIDWREVDISTPGASLVSAEAMAFSPELAYISGIANTPGKPEVYKKTLYSDDYLNWHATTAPNYNHFDAVAIGNGRLLDASERGTLTISQAFQPNAAPTVELSTYPPQATKSDHPIIIEANANDPDNDPLHYFWSTGDGHYSSYSNSLYASAETETPLSARLLVSDTRGGIAEATLMQQLEDSVGAPNPFQRWTAERNYPTDFDIGRDSDLDGRSDFAEYAFDTEKLKLPRASSDLASAALFTGDSQLSYHCLISNDLSSWRHARLAFDPQSQRWTVDSQEIVIAEARYTDKGVWQLGFRFLSESNARFIRFRAERSR
ncbi:PKD domain-containing protein [Pelagicoccus sp. SDUM812003]|uniref:PKD domain-containing protein n=1 Tax=Pelagicoccus sp. SDUM812003 TaxID=3041267 RepID=UPI00280CF7B5|nr:PKD domain-containing protein [Pelagicoccus sp. SDUM812003]MDQ8204117.1 PKD domain-containing protein [Pelagicoccus sp. SDUM812003]